MNGQKPVFRDKSWPRQADSVRSLRKIKNYQKTVLSEIASIHEVERPLEPSPGQTIEIRDGLISQL
jgi:hypothetical protein